MPSLLELIILIFSSTLISSNIALLPSNVEIEEILRTHNNYRANVKPASNAMMLLTWHPEGAKRAEKMANQCIFEHDNSENRATSEFPDGGGQNLFATNATKRPPWSYAIKAWHDEVELFKYGKDSGNFKKVGHYTQMVWGTTKKIGCAWSNCPSLKIYTCNYYPPGNFFPYYVPYRKARVQSCSGCLSNATCATQGPYKGKLLEKCDLFCQDKYSNCQDLAKRIYAFYSKMHVPSHVGKNANPENN